MAWTDVWTVCKTIFKNKCHINDRWWLLDNYDDDNYKSLIKSWQGNNILVYNNNYKYYIAVL